MGGELCCQQKPVKLISSSVCNKIRKESSRHTGLCKTLSTDIQIKNKKLSFQDFCIRCTIGKGGYGTVLLVEEKINIKKNIKIQYAIKIIPKKIIYQKSFIQQLLSQKHILSSVKNHFLISLVYGFQDKKNCYLVTEYAQGGDVYPLISTSRKHIKKSTAFRSLGEEGVKFIVACVVLGLECMHLNNLIYRDLKPENVLIFQNGYVKLSDFGLSKRVQQGDKTNSLAGTKFYLAPQIVERCGHNHLVDLWAIGVFMIELLRLDQPFLAEDIVKGKFMKKCKDIEYNKIWQNSFASQQAINLIIQLMKVEPRKRIGAQGVNQIKVHPFFKSIDWEKLQNLQLQSPLKSIIQKYPVIPHKHLQISHQQITEDEEGFPKIEGLTYQRNTKSTFQQ